MNPNAPPPTDPNALVATRPVGLDGILEFVDLRIGIKDFSVDFSKGAQPFSGTIFFASGGAKFFPGKPINATITDRLTADDRNPDGTLNDEALRLELTFTAGKVDAFKIKIDTLEINISTFVTLTARDFMLNTGAAANQELVSFGAVGAKVKIGTLELGGEGRNFAFMGDGSFKAKTGFGVFLSIGGATGDSFQWPSFLPIKIDSIGIRWIGNIETDPSNFELILSASITAIQGVSGLQFTGSVEGIRINPSLLAQGKMPITRIDSLGVTVKGAMFGGEIDAGIVGGILRLDANYNIIGVFDDTTPVHQRVFYLGLQGGFSMAGMAGFTIRVGLSELGPLSAFINIEIPGGILLEPITGLTINDFSAGVEFFKTLPSIDDPFALRSSAFQLPTAQTADEWLNGLQRQVAAQAKAISVNPALNGFTAAFTAPMTITGGAKVYTIYTSQAVFNGEVIVKISTDGKFLIVGKLNFAADNISISGRLYADLSKIASGSATVLFLADVPDQVRVLTIYGKLKMGFKNANGEDVVFDVLDVPATQPGALKPTATIMNPATAGGSSAVTTAQNYVDVLFTAPKGGGLDLDSIMQMVTKITLHRGATPVQLHRHHADVADRGRRRAGLRPAAPRRQRHPARDRGRRQALRRHQDLRPAGDRHGLRADARGRPQDQHHLLPLLARVAGVDGRRLLGHDHRGRVQGPRRLDQRRARVPVRPRRRHRAPVRPGRRRHDRHQRPQPAQLDRRRVRRARAAGSGDRRRLDRRPRSRVRAHRRRPRHARARRRRARRRSSSRDTSRTATG